MTDFFVCLNITPELVLVLAASGVIRLIFHNITHRNEKLFWRLQTSRAPENGGQVEGHVLPAAFLEPNQHEQGTARYLYALKHTSVLAEHRWFRLFRVKLAWMLFSFCTYECLFALLYGDARWRSLPAQWSRDQTVGGVLV